MALNSPFGTVLRDEREAKGFELNEVARRLRIRPDILRAIESNDFAHMPPRGYARNMVNAYARFLGLNPTEITRAYMDQNNQFQEAAAARDDLRLETRQGRSSSRGSSRPERQSYAERAADRGYRGSQSGRTLYNDRYDSRTDAGRYGDQGRTVRPVGTSRQQRGGGQPYANFYSGGQQGSSPLDFLKSKWLYIAIAVAAVVLIFIITNIVSCATAAPEEESSTVPISGMSDTTKSDDDSEEETKVVEVAPTSAVFKYEVDSGKTAYIEIYENGSDTPTVADEVSGSESYEVTKKLKFVTSDPDNVTITVDGEKVKAKENGSTGVYNYTVKFSDILEDWEKEHSSSSSSSSSKSSD